MSNTDIAIAAIRQLYKADEEIEKLKAENAELQAKWDYYQQFCADHGAHGIADLAVQRDALRAQLTTALAALEACDEAMGYMSEYDIPITLPDQVKEAIAAIGGGEWRTGQDYRNWKSPSCSVTSTWSRPSDTFTD